jgi:AraC-like DNA-binding protein
LKPTKPFLKALAIFCAVLGLILGFALDFKTLEVLDHKPASIKAYTDQNAEGKSTCALGKGPQLQYHYVIREGATYPNAGMIMEFDSVIDASSFTHVKINFKNPEQKRLHFFYMVKSNDKVFKFRSEIETEPDMYLYTLPLEQFQIPSWYIKDQKLTNEEIAQAGRAQVFAFSMSHDLRIAFEEEDSVCIESIELYHENGPTYVITLILFGVGSIGLFVFFQFRQKKEIVYTPVTVEEPQEAPAIKSDLDEVVDYIAAHYQDPELSLAGIRKALKIPENKISTLIKEQFNLGYKDYVNGIRIHQAKDLLKSSDEPIGNVAYTCGFGSLTTFNRLFKEATGQTPTDFREV